MKNDLAEMQRIRNETVSGTGKPADQLSPQELHSKLWGILSLRDKIVKKIELTIESIPGLGPLLEKIMDAISVLVFTTLEPLLKPLMTSATSGLQTASGEVIDKNDQYEVFNLPNATDPTHSFLSKDHFNLLLNEPAGHLAKIIVTHAVDLIVRAWDDSNMNVHHVTEDILQCLFHPDFHNENSKIQREMMKYMHSWINSLGSQTQVVLSRLTKEAVRNHQNTRVPTGGGTAILAGVAGQHSGHHGQTGIHQHLQNTPGVAQVHSLSGMVSGIAGSRVQGYEDTQTHNADTGNRHHHQHHQQHNQHHGGRHQDSRAPIPSHGSSVDDPSMPSFPTIPGLGISGSPATHSSGGPLSVPYPIYQSRRDGSSSYVPSVSPSSFPSMPRESSIHSGYAPSYAPPPPLAEPFGFSGPAYRGVEDGHYNSGGRDGRWTGATAFEAQPQYGFAPAFPEAPQPHGGHHSHDGPHSHGGSHSHGGHRHGEHRHGKS